MFSKNKDYKECVWCKNHLTGLRARNPMARYCSPDCARREKNRVHNEKYKERIILYRLKLRKEHPENFVCRICSKILLGGKTKYCSETCWNKHRAKTSKYEYWKYKSYFQRYYQENKEKYLAWSHQQHLKKGGKPRPPEWNVCAICSKDVPKERRIFAIRTCSKECSKKYRKIYVDRANAKYYRKAKQIAKDRNN